MNISTLKILFYLLTFQKSKIPEYLLDVGNNWVVNGLADATKERILAGLDTGRMVLSALIRYSWLCPERWRKAYQTTVSAFTDVVTACSDLQITIDEVEQATASFKIAYAEWCAD